MPNTISLLICRPKSKRGLGFKKFEDFNKVLLAKAVWDLTIQLENPWVEIFNSKYFKEEPFLTVQKMDNDSYIWKGLLWTRDTLEKVVGKWVMVL